MWNKLIVFIRFFWSRVIFACFPSPDCQFKHLHFLVKVRQMIAVVFSLLMWFVLQYLPEINALDECVFATISALFRSLWCMIWLWNLIQIKSNATKNSKKICKIEQKRESKTKVIEEVGAACVIDSFFLCGYFLFFWLCVCVLISI